MSTTLPIPLPENWSTLTDAQLSAIPVDTVMSVGSNIATNSSVFKNMTIKQFKLLQQAPPVNGSVELAFYYVFGNATLPAPDAKSLLSTDSLQRVSFFVDNLTPDKISKIKWDQKLVTDIPPIFLAFMTSAQIAAIPASQLSIMTSNQKTAISPAIVATLTPEQKTAISSAIVATLTPEQKTTISPAIVATNTATSKNPFIQLRNWIKGLFRFKSSFGGNNICILMFLFLVLSIILIFKSVNSFGKKRR